MCLIIVRTQQCQDCNVRKGWTTSQDKASVREKSDLFLWHNFYQAPPTCRSICLVTPWQFSSSLLLRQYANNTWKKQSGMHLMIFLCCITIYGLGPIIFFFAWVANVLWVGEAIVVPWNYLAYFLNKVYLDNWVTLEGNITRFE